MESKTKTQKNAKWGVLGRVGGVVDPAKTTAVLWEICSHSTSGGIATAQDVALFDENLILLLSEDLESSGW